MRMTAMMTMSAVTRSGRGTGGASREPMNCRAMKTPQPRTSRRIAVGVMIERRAAVMKGLPVSEAVLIVNLTQPGRPGRFLPLSGYPGSPGPANRVIWGTGMPGVVHLWRTRSTRSFRADESEPLRMVSRLLKGMPDCRPLPPQVIASPSRLNPMLSVMGRTASSAPMS